MLHTVLFVDEYMLFSYGLELFTARYVKPGTRHYEHIYNLINLNVSNIRVQDLGYVHNLPQVICEKPLTSFRRLPN